MLYPALRELMKEDLEERWKIGWEKGEKVGWEKGEKAGWEKGEKAGREKGEKVGWEKGISGAVGIYRDEMGLDDAAIAERISKRFHLTREQAAGYVSAQS